LKLFSRIKKIPWINKYIINIYCLVNKLYMFLCNKLIGVNEKDIVFISFCGKSYSDNPRAISEKLYRLDPEFNIYWMFINPKEKETILPEYIKSVKLKSFEALKILATSKFWVDNFNKPLYVYKSKNQIYIQTWHGDRAFKRILYDAWQGGDRPYPLIEKNICDLIVTGSKFAERMYRSAFKYDGEFLRVGSPRNDVLFNLSEERNKIIKERLSIDVDRKVLLYAPTFRQRASKEKTDQKISIINLLELIKSLNLKTKHKWVCLTRAHSAVPGLKGIPYSDDIIDVTKYEDMADLLQITDLLITDYSSSATDFILTDKPTILYQSDIEEYLKNDRTFYYDVKDTGFLIAYDQNELDKAIDIMLEEETTERNKRIQEFYGVYESGSASRQVAEYIINLSK
jgi:CDP-glycerol glycerophosphotransferase